MWGNSSEWSMKDRQNRKPAGGLSNLTRTKSLVEFGTTAVQHRHEGAALGLIPEAAVAWFDFFAQIGTKKSRVLHYLME